MNYKECDKFSEETIRLLSELKDLRSTILVILLSLEQLANELIKSRFKKPEVIFKNNTLEHQFSNKLDILEAVGIDKILIDDIRDINNIRNTFAHQLFSERKLPEKIESKVRDRIKNIVQRNIKNEKSKKHLLNAKTETMLVAAGHAIIIKLLTYVRLEYDKTDREKFL